MIRYQVSADKPKSVVLPSSLTFFFQVPKARPRQCQETNSLANVSIVFVLDIWPTLDSVKPLRRAQLLQLGSVQLVSVPLVRLPLQLVRIHFGFISERVYSALKTKAGLVGEVRGQYGANIGNIFRSCGGFIMNL
jgi:hypothetical protein